MDFSKLALARRSVRTFSSQTVSDNLVKQVVECGRVAPSWKNWQGWHFIVVRDKDKIAEIVDNGGVFGNKWLRNAPALLIACGDPAKSGDMNGVSYITVDVSIALDHIVLAATELGLGTCWVGIFDAAKLKEALGIPGSQRIIALTPLGYPADGMSVRERLSRMAAGSKRRKPIEEILHFEQW
jgi:nitroreductase